MSNTAEKIAAKIIEATAEIKEKEEYVKNLRAKLGELVEDGTTPIGDFLVKRRVNKRFDAGLATKTLDPETLASISVTKPDATKAKALLDEVQLEACQKTYGVVVSVDLRND